MYIKITWILIFFVFLSVPTWAQQKSFTIQGTLVSEDDQPLEAATIHLETIKDSTVVTYTISGRQGQFELKGRAYNQNLNLFISYVGYGTYKQEVALGNEAINLGKIVMKSSTDELDEIVIRSRAPITVKKDTLEFNASSFNVKKDATVEDLLKELPGVEVDADGAITVNGKPVNQLLVNGKSFFGNDPTIATRNLTKEMIEKVQVVDTKTEAQAFTGQRGDSENKTINLTISEDKNKGVFGRISAGAGTDKRYEAAGLLNSFDNDQRLSVLGGTNNINSPGFSFGEIQKMFGGGRSIMMNSSGGFRMDGMSFGMGDGIVVSQLGGANYADKYGKSTDILVNYFFSGSESNNEQITNRETIYPDSRFFSYSNAASNTDTDSHTVNMKLDIKAGKNLLISYTPSFSYAKMISKYRSNESTYNELDEIINSSESSNYQQQESQNFSNKMSITQKFGEKGAYVSIALDAGFENIASQKEQYSQTLFYDDFTENQLQDQRSGTDIDNRNFNSEITYALPLKANEYFLNFKYKYDTKKKENIESNYDFNETTGEYDLFNTLLSSDFTFYDNRSVPSLSFAIRKENWNFNIESGYDFISLKSNDRLRLDTANSKNYEAVNLSSNIYYRFSNRSSFHMSYRLNNESPAISELQPYQDVSNPLHIVEGNPDLNPAKKHNVNLGYNAFNFQTGIGFNFYGQFSYVQDAAVRETTIDENFVRYTTYRNEDGNMFGSGGGSYRRNIKIDSLQTLTVGGGAWLNINKNYAYNHDVKYETINQSIRPNVTLRYVWKDIVDVSANYGISFGKSEVDIEQVQDRNFATHNLRINTATFLPKNWEWRNDVVYSYNPDVAKGFDNSAWFWNSTLNFSFMNDNAMLSLKVYDILDQNNNTRRSSTDNYIQDTQGTVLERYFMLGFTWKFNTLGTQDETGKRGGGFRMF